MQRFFLRIGLIAALLLGGVSDFLVEVGADTVVSSAQQAETCIGQDEDSLQDVAGQHRVPFGQALLDASSPQRVSAQRPVRLLPTYGGKPGKSMGRWAGSTVVSTQAYPALPQSGGRVSPRRRAASPRFYYVIALRRILC